MFFLRHPFQEKRAPSIAESNTNLAVLWTHLVSIRSGHVVTEGGELLQVYEEVVLPDGTSAKLDESGEVVTTDSNGVGGLTHPGVGSLSLPTTPLPPQPRSQSGKLPRTGMTTPGLLGRPLADVFLLC